MDLVDYGLDDVGYHGVVFSRGLSLGRRTEVLYC